MRRIGGSDIPMLLGISKYGNEADVFLRIVEGADRLWTKPMTRGNVVEPDLRSYAVKVLNLEITEHHDSDYHHVHPGNDFAHAQVDDIGTMDDECGSHPVCVDYKSQSTFAKGWGAAYTDVVPEPIRAQVAWEMACTDLDLALVVTGFGTDTTDGGFNIANVVPYVLERDGVYESYILGVGREFWEKHILTGIPPDVKPLARYEIKECA